MSTLEKFYMYGFEEREIQSKDLMDENDVGISDNTRFILSQRYYLNRYDASIGGVRKESSYFELCRRVSRMVASGETIYTTDIERVRLIEANIFDDMWNRRFLFNSPALFNLGIDLVTNEDFSKIIYDEDTISYDDYKRLFDNKSSFQMCFACFVVPVDDDLSGIYDSVKNAAIISMKGGGVGTNFGRTREKGAPIRHGQGGVSSGPISWMKQWNTMATEVVQGGRRRAALMGMMDVNHPDIEEFISCKDDDQVLSYFNISVAITDEFMRAVENDDEFVLKSRVDSKYDKVVRARDLWHKICEHAHKRGDPGIHFVDASNQDSLLKKSKRWVIEATNPCGEMNLPFKVNDPNYKSYSIGNIGVEPKWYESASNTSDSENGNCCNLGSINLTKFVVLNDEITPATFDYNAFIKQIKRSCYYLDLVIDVSAYPLDGIEKNTKAIRPIGLGFMGIHDTGIMLNMPFDTKPDAEFSKLCNKIGAVLGMYSLEASIDMVNLIGKAPFPEVQCVKDLMAEYVEKVYAPEIAFCDILKSDTTNILPQSIRNTLIYAYESHHSIEMFSALLHGKLRNSRRLSEAPTGTISLICDVSSGVEPNFAYAWDRKVIIPDGNGGNKIETRHYVHNLVPEMYLEELEETGKINNPVFKSAMEIDPSDHLGIVAIFSKYFDCSLSKTINLPNSATVEDIEKIYNACYKQRIKGITIYRDGSRTGQPLTVKKGKNESADDQIKKDIVDDDMRRPLMGIGAFTQVKSPYGTLHVSAKFNEKDEMREVFITLNKSGQELKAVTEAIARLVSLILQECANYKSAYRRVIKTLKGIAGFEIFVYDGVVSGMEHVVKSIADVVSYILPDLEFIHLSNKYGGREEALPRMIAKVVSDHSIVEQAEAAMNEYIEKYNKNKGLVCPECGGTSFYKSDGCDKCLTCGASKCAVG